MEETTAYDELRKQIFQKIDEKDFDGFQQLIVQIRRGGVDFVDHDGMSPLQHAACKGQLKMVEQLLAMGADIHFNRHGAHYTALHFAALSGNVEVCRKLLQAGIDPASVNSVSRTAAQMAAFVGNYSCVEIINNYVRPSKVLFYTEKHIWEPEALLPKILSTSFHTFITAVNLHPVRIVLNLQNFNLLKHLQRLKKILELMCAREMQTSNDANEVLAFKFHYLFWIVSELQRCQELCAAQRQVASSNAAGDTGAGNGNGTATGTGTGTGTGTDTGTCTDTGNKAPIATTNTIPLLGKTEFVDTFIKRVLKENKQGDLDYVEFMVRECVREFSFRECPIYQQVVSQLAHKEPMPALRILRIAINGHRGLPEEPTYCSTCGTENPDKKCSKCRSVQYCNRECQRYHWFMHKKTCARGAASASATKKENPPIDMDELSKEITNMTAAE